jgi:malonyl-CoA O-methyltransferase
VSQLKSRVRRSFEKSAADYDRHAPYQIETARQLADRIADGPLPAGPMVDAGCGAGALTGALADRGIAVAVACDLAFNMVRRVEREKRVPVAQADAEALPFADRSVGAVVSNMMIQWLPDPSAAFAEMRRILRPGGRLYLTTLGAGTLAEMRQAMEAVVGEGGGVFHPFLPLDRVIRSAEGAGFSVAVAESVLDRRVYADPFVLLKGLKGVGAQNATGLAAKGLGRRRAMTAFADDYLRRFATPGGVFATYETLYLFAVAG